MSDSPSIGCGSVGLPSLLVLLFVTLKLIGEHFHTPVADWSWWWVLSPLWIGAILGILILIFVVVIAALTDN